MTIKEVQQALSVLGFNPGPIDGLNGRRTIKAIKEFQAQNSLAIDGIIGPKTLSALFKNSIVANDDDFAIPLAMPWIATAFALIGTQEISGRGSNEAILGWAEDLELTAYNDDDIPWCGLFMGHCIGSQLPEEPLPAKLLGARQWSRLGYEVSPRFGSILVFWRGSPTGWKGHVGFYWAEDNEAFHVLGGNQSNAVTVTRIAKSRLLTARWPSTALALPPQTRSASPSGKLLSVNEA